MGYGLTCLHNFLVPSGLLFDIERGSSKRETGETPPYCSLFIKHFHGVPKSGKLVIGSSCIVKCVFYQDPKHLGLSEKSRSIFA